MKKLSIGSNQTLSNYQIRFAYVNGKSIQYKLVHQPVVQPYICTHKGEIFVICSKKSETYTTQEFVPKYIDKYVYINDKKEEHSSINTDLSKFKIFEKYYLIKQANFKNNLKYEIINSTIYLNQKYQKQQIIKDVYNDIVTPYIKKKS